VEREKNERGEEAVAAACYWRGQKFEHKDKKSKL
jgi:hypothetical protein